MGKRKRSLPEWFRNPPKMPKKNHPSNKSERKRAVVYYMSPEELLKAAKYFARDPSKEPRERSSSPVNVGASTSSAVRRSDPIPEGLFPSSPDITVDCGSSSQRSDSWDFIEQMDRVHLPSLSSDDDTEPLKVSRDGNISNMSDLEEIHNGDTKSNLRNTDNDNSTGSDSNRSFTLVEKYLDTQFFNSDKEDTQILPKKKEEQCRAAGFSKQFSSGTGKILDDLVAEPGEKDCSVDVSNGDITDGTSLRSQSPVDDAPIVRRSESFRNTETYLDEFWGSD